MAEKKEMYFLCGSCGSSFVLDLEYEVSSTLNKETGATSCIVNEREILTGPRVGDDGRVSCTCGNVDSILITTKEGYDELIGKSKHE